MSQNKQLKYVKGALEKGKPACICFYDDVDYWSASDFIAELKWIENYYEPSEITVSINSSGGNCVDGISVFTAIQNCKTPVTTINEGLAASMASIIWSAGDKCKMKDYALLMIHNPFMTSTNDDDPNQQAIINAFKSQLRTIYMKRFCMDESTVDAIMNGAEGVDGTWFTADEAVAKGFLSADNVIQTESILKNKVAASLQDIKTRISASVMAEAAGLEKPKAQTLTIMDKGVTSQNNNKTMNDQILKIVAGLLNMGDATEAAVTAKITGLKDIEAKYGESQKQLKEVNNQLATVKTELEGAKASVKNLTENLDKTKAELKVYKDAEAAAHKAKVEALVDEAIKACKINKEARESWISMAEANYETAKQALDSIPAREDIPGAIAQQADNKQDAEKGMTEEQRKALAAIDALVGKDFKYRTTDEL